MTEAEREQLRRDAQTLPYSWERTTIETIVNHDPNANWWCGAAYGLARAFLDARKEAARQRTEGYCGRTSPDRADEDYERGHE